MPMKILVSDSIPKSSVGLLRAAPGVEVVEQVGLTEEQLLPLVADIDAWVVRSATKVTRRLMELYELQTGGENALAQAAWAH